jgi:2-polyprenyl-3-methyl-5-hydroxy-6-metoxy-1,4-benzoquinol methylase
MISPNTIMINKFGVSSNLEVLKQLLVLQKQYIVDIGCGDGAFTQTLAEPGAGVTGIEPNPVQAEKIVRCLQTGKCSRLKPAQKRFRWRTTARIV